jgi:hypothetical protein
MDAPRGVGVQILGVSQNRSFVRTDLASPPMDRHRTLGMRTTTPTGTQAPMTLGDS